MTLEEFKDFYYNVCNINYEKMKNAMEPLKRLMSTTDKVHIITTGMALEKSNNGNKSAIHWDIVKILREEYGGGEIYFDNDLIMKDGKFVLPELIPLNPENLK